VRALSLAEGAYAYSASPGKDDDLMIVHADAIHTSGSNALSNNVPAAAVCVMSYMAP